MTNGINVHKNSNLLLCVTCLAATTLVEVLLYLKEKLLQKN